MPQTQPSRVTDATSLQAETLHAAENWLGITPAARIQAALDAALPKLASDPVVRATLQSRGIATRYIETAVKTDLQRLAHAVTLLVEHKPQSVLGDLMPAHLGRALAGLEYSLDHIGREILCPPDSLLAAWHRAREQLGFGARPGETGGVPIRDDLIFPSVQVVEAIRKEDPSVEAVTIAASFLCPSAEAKPTYIELFFPGHRDGSAAQHARFMESRLSSMRCDPHRLVAPRLPICHLSVEVQDRQALQSVHRLAAEDRSGLVTPYADNISINPGDGSHNTKMAVRKQLHPANPVSVIEFIYFDR